VRGNKIKTNATFFQDFSDSDPSFKVTSDSDPDPGLDQGQINFLEKSK